MNWQLFASTFGLIVLAELPDKTAIAIVLMATKMRPLAVFVGVGLAYLVQTAVAVAFGKVLSLLPPRLVHLGAGLVFLGFAMALGWQKGEEADGEPMPAPRAHFWRACLTSFWVIFVAEWGDLTQLATASLVARGSDPLTVFVAALAGLWVAAVILIFVGHHSGKLISPKRIRQFAVAVFAAIGLYFVVEAICAN